MVVKDVSGNTAEAPAFSAALDDSIIKGFLTDRRRMIKTLKSKGFTRDEILERARHLGLSDQFVKWCSIGNSDVALRNCLGCGERFLSVGFQNRLCPRCKNRRF